MVHDVVGEWTDPERVAEYLSREIPHRDIAEELLLEALPRRVGRVLDLGTGDGRLLALVCSRHAGAQAVGIDSSQPMFARAAERFGSSMAVELGVHDLNQPLAVSVPFDAVVSGLAIHHLSDERKRALFSEVHALLTPGGVFVNLDLVVIGHPGAARALPPGDRARRGRPRGSSCEHVRAARLAARGGLRGVDCHFKWLELALIVAARAPSGT